MLRVVALNLLRVLVVSLLSLLLLAGPAQASSTPPIFGGPAVIDRLAPFPPFGSSNLTSISCGSPSSCVAVGEKVAQYTTNAGTTSPPVWSSPTVITTGSLVSVSCPTSSLCVAITSNGTALHSTDGGMTWSAPVTVETGAGLSTVACSVAGICLASAGEPVYISSDGGQTWSGPDDTPSGTPLVSMSCLPSGACVAVGADGFSILIASDVGGPGPPTWTATHLAEGFFTGVSCTPNGICVAVDTFGYAWATSDVNAATPSWSRVLVDGTGSLANGLVGLASISCAQSATDSTTDTCVAGDVRGSTAISTDVGGAAPSTWSIVPTFDTGNLEPTDGGVYAGVGELYPVVCVSTGWCLAADVFGNVTYGIVPAGAPQTTVWSPPVTLNGLDFMNAVSCSPNGQVCAALDTTGHAVTSVDGGAQWSGPVNMNPAFAGGPGPDQSAPLAVSCVNSGQCVAVEQSIAVVGSNSATYTNVLRSTPTAAGATWTGAEVDLSGTLNGVPTGPPMSGLSCAAGGLCAAVDTAENSVISTDGGATWTVVPTGAPSALESVSCGTSTSCVAVDSTGHVVYSTNLASASPVWSPPLAIDAGAALTAVSCTPQGICAAVDNKGRAVTTGDGGLVWSKPAGIEGSSAVALVSVSCTAADLCVALDSHGNAYYTINPGAAGPIWTLASSNASDLTAISCTGVGFCVGVDAVGEAIDGVSEVGKASLSGATGAFPDTVLGTSSPPQTVAVTNSGAAPLNVARATLTGPDSGQFAITGNTCNGTFVPPGASCGVSLEFSPASTGAYSAADLVISSDAGTSPDEVALSGTGVLGPVLSLMGGSASFPDTAVGALSPAHTVTATNTGGAPLHVEVAALTGAEAGQFKLSPAAGCAGAVLAPGAGCSVGVKFAPTRTGTQTASLEFDTNAQPSQSAVKVSGSAVSAPAAANAFSFVSVKAGKRGVITTELRLPRAGSFSLSTSATLPAASRAGARRAQRKLRRITYSPHVVAAIRGPTTATIRITPTRAAAAALKKDHRLRVVVSVTFAPTGVARRTETSAVTVSGG